MSYVDVGKDAKRAGRTKPSVARKLDPVPEKHPPGVAKPHKKVEKPFGFSYEERCWWRSDDQEKWKRRYQWFETERARDQSMKALSRKIATWDWYRDLRAERRSGES